MSGYIEAGYTVTLCTLGAYALSVGLRERAARRRIGHGDASGEVASVDRSEAAAKDNQAGELR